MAITYAKIINSLTCYSDIDGETDVVFTINWNLTGTEGVLYSSYPCATSVPYTAGQPFVPYADLTEEQVLQWIDEYTDPDMMAFYYKIIADNIEQQKVVVTPPLPWIPPLS
jgi:hypothetical protein